MGNDVKKVALESLKKFEMSIEDTENRLHSQDVALAKNFVGACVVGKSFGYDYKKWFRLNLTASKMKRHYFVKYYLSEHQKRLKL
jgi:hypothetical protein